MVKIRAFRTLENTIRRLGFNLVAGVDEVGRGCLAGPVVAAAVVLDPDRYIPRICDSKTVTAIERVRLYDQITRSSIAGLICCQRRRSVRKTRRCYENWCGRQGAPPINKRSWL